MYDFPLAPPSAIIRRKSTTSKCYYYNQNTRPGLVVIRTFKTLLETTSETTL